MFLPNSAQKQIFAHKKFCGLASSHALHLLWIEISWSFSHPWNPWKISTLKILGYMVPCKVADQSDYSISTIHLISVHVEI